MKVIVTGISGYIGGQVALQLLDAGHDVRGIDWRPLPSHLQDLDMKCVQADFSSSQAFGWIEREQPDAVIHCAGTSLVGPSMVNPADYFTNNVVRTLSLLNFLRTAAPRVKVIFSSSAAVYGEPVMTPCQEVDPCEPISPYGDSKLMIERMMDAYHKAYDLNYVAFRYFNACGADPQGRHGQAPGATHIIARVLESIRDNQEFTLYGNSYPTADGTCVRDYVHVDDIAMAHVLALCSVVPSGIYNLGSNTGTSNLEIIDAAQRITGRTLRTVVAPQRPGDPPQLTADDGKFAAINPWRQYSLDDMISHAWKWYVR